MSSSSSSSSQYYHEPGLSFESGLIIAVGVLGLLVVLVILRCCCNVCIDVTVLGDVESAQRYCGDVWRCLCPWWRPRTRPELPQDNEPTSREIEFHQARSGMSAEAWKEMVNSILPSKKVVAEDLALWKEGQGCSSGEVCIKCDDHDDQSHSHDTCTGIVCSICLHDLELGDSAVVSTNCQHVFHNDCIISWLQRNLACPYCRVDMISRERLQEAIRLRGSS